MAVNIHEFLEAALLWIALAVGIAVAVTYCDNKGKEKKLEK